MVANTLIQLWLQNQWKQNLVRHGVNTSAAPTFTEHVVPIVASKFSSYFLPEKVGQSFADPQTPSHTLPATPRHSTDRLQWSFDFWFKGEKLVQTTHTHTHTCVCWHCGTCDMTCNTEVATPCVKWGARTNEISAAAKAITSTATRTTKNIVHY